MRQSRGPVGYLGGSFDELHAAGCIQTGGDDTEYTLEQSRERHGRMFHALMLATAKNPCDGCPVYKDGKCAAFKQYHTSQFSQRHAQHPTSSGGAANRCRECGCRVRGKNHADGEHHRNKVKKATVVH